MDDFKIILYILAAVAYFLLTQWRKAFKGGDEEDQDVDVEPRAPYPRQQPPKPVTSFEDILRELQPKVEQAKQEGQQVVRQASERSEVSTQNLPQTATAAKPAPKYRNYENSTPKVLSWEKRAEAIEAAKNSKFLNQDLSSIPSQKTERVTNKYAKMLRNPASARDAVILSEIFNRKYS